MWSRSQIMWSRALRYSQSMWSQNHRCNRSPRGMLSVRYSYLTPQRSSLPSKDPMLNKFPQREDRASCAQFERLPLAARIMRADTGAPILGARDQNSVDPLAHKLLSIPEPRSSRLLCGRLPAACEDGHLPEILRNLLLAREVSARRRSPAVCARIH
jgi:hypothetical protein